MANADTLPQAPFLTVAPPPHIHCGRTVPGQMKAVIIALIPAVIGAVCYFGFDALRVIGLSCATAVAVEALCLKIMKRDIQVDDFSALLMGLVFAMLLPASAPWWLVMVGSGLTIILGKQVFGGIGASPVNPALVGWAALSISWPTHMSADASMLMTEMINPLSELKYFGLEAAHQLTSGQMFLGDQLAGLGSAQVVALLIGGLFLIVRGNIKCYIPLSFLAGVFATAAVFYGMDSDMYASPVFHLLAGSTVFGAFFLATDPSSSPVTKPAMLLYGLIGGAMVVIIRVYGIYPDGVPFAVLLTSLFTPLYDMIKPKPFGAK